MGTIRTVQQLAEYLGADAPTTESITRCVYKRTECGAWAKVQGPTLWGTGGKRTETWIATITKSIAGYVCVKLRKEHALMYLPQEFERKVPKEVRDYFLLKPSPTNANLWVVDAPEDDPDFVRNLKPEADILSVSTRGLTTVVKGQVSFPRTRKVAGVFTVGSIVEGSDAEVAPVEVTLPCSSEAIDRAIKDVEFEADRLWREANEPEEGAEAT